MQIYNWIKIKLQYKEKTMNEQKINEEVMDVDILGSIEFDLTESIKDLIYNIKTVKEDVTKIKEHLHLEQ